MVKGGGARPGFASSFQARLIGHIHRCAEQGDTSDVEALVQQLRKAHDGYARLKLPPFRKHVQRALEAMQAARRPSEVNLQVTLQAAGSCACVMCVTMLTIPCVLTGALDRHGAQAQEHAHLQARARDADQPDSNDASSSSSDGLQGDAPVVEDGTDANEPGITDAVTGRTLLPGTSLNATLLGMYAPPSAAPATAPGAASGEAPGPPEAAIAPEPVPEPCPARALVTRTAQEAGVAR